MLSQDIQVVYECRQGDYPGIDEGIALHLRFC